MHSNIICALLVSAAGALCLAGEPKKTADMVARDLNITGLGWAGHVGLWTGSRVLEVVKANKDVIKDNTTLKDFKAASSYWGAKYQNDKKDFAKVITVGRDQMKFSPTYTITATYTVGKKETKRVWNPRTGRWENKDVITPGVFRCDTFAYYCYLTGANINLAPKDVILPKVVYANMPKTR